MIFLFMAFLSAIILALFRLRSAAIIMTLVSLALCLWMFWYHATSTLEVLL